MPNASLMPLGLAEAIADLRREITQAVALAEGQPLQFALGSIDLELQVQLMANAGAKAGLKWVVVSVEADGRAQATHTHRIKLTLTPSVDGHALSVAGRKTQRRN